MWEDCELGDPFDILEWPHGLDSAAVLEQRLRGAAHFLYGEADIPADRGEE